jgi:hypothetical protein
MNRNFAIRNPDQIHAASQSTCTEAQAHSDHTDSFNPASHDIPLFFIRCLTKKPMAGGNSPVGKQRGIDIVEAMRLRLNHKATTDEQYRATHNGD